MSFRSLDMLLDDHHPALSDGFVLGSEPELSVVAIHGQTKLLLALLQRNEALIKVEVERATALTFAIFHLVVLQNTFFHLDFATLPSFEDRWAELLEVT